SLLDAEKTLLHPHRTRAAAGVAGFGLGAGFRAATVAGIAVVPARNTDFSVEPGGGLFQRNFESVLEIGAAIHLRTAGPAPAAATEYFAENIPESVSESACSATHATSGGWVDAGMAVSVIGFAFVGFRENFVGV